MEFDLRSRNIWISTMTLRLNYQQNLQLHFLRAVELCSPRSYHHYLKFLIHLLMDFNIISCSIFPALTSFSMLCMLATSCNFYSTITGAINFTRVDISPTQTRTQVRRAFRHDKHILGEAGINTRSLLT